MDVGRFRERHVAWTRSTEKTERGGVEQTNN
jgi:hypothetical protein